VYCTLLASSQIESEKEALRAKMKEDPHLAKILHQLETGKTEDNEAEGSESRSKYAISAFKMIFFNH
jgi:N-terminal helicase PWI domain